MSLSTLLPGDFFSRGRHYSRNNGSHDTTIRLMSLNSESNPPVLDDVSQTVGDQEGFNTTGKDCRPRGRLFPWSGFHIGILSITVLVICVLIINLVITVFVMIAYPVSDGIGTLFEGECARTSSWSSRIHVGINILSSALLSGSNYCMQRLCAPTRSDIDEEHAQGRWMDIGVPSIRNLKVVSLKRKILWVSLGISSIPLHLFYNSAVFETLAAQQYHAAVVTEDFLKGGSHATNLTSGFTPDPLRDPTYLTALQQKIISRPEDFTTLNNEECISKYSASFITDAGDVLGITKDPLDSLLNTTVWVYSSLQEVRVRKGSWLWHADMAYPNNTVIPFPRDSSTVGHLFICADYTVWSELDDWSGSQCSIDYMRKDSTSWNVDGKSISYCLSEVKPERCQLRCSITILWIVVAFNLVKALSMLWILFRLRDNPLVTLGDAISSFLQQPDQTTKGFCLLSRADVECGHWPGTQHYITKGFRLLSKADVERQHGPGTSRYEPSLLQQSSQLPWFSAVTRRRAITCMALCTVTLIGSIGLLISGMRTVGTSSFQSLWAMGFGSLRGDSLVAPSIGTSLNSAVLLANLPQLIISFLYVLYNGLLTSMLASVEWSLFSIKRQPLRVTVPKGQQRSTYWLQLPHVYAIPLIVAMAMLHWLVAQSIFLASVVFYNDGQELVGDDNMILGCGFSCIAIIFAIFLGCILLLALLGNGFRRYDRRSRISLVSSCSAAIAAACHPPQDDVEADHKFLQWGALVERYDDTEPLVLAHEGESATKYEHCCLTSFEVALITRDDCV